MMDTTRPPSCRFPLPALLFLALASVLFAPLAPLRAETTPAASVLSVVIGIVNYTRWPEGRNPLRFCLVGKSAYFERLRAIPAATLQNMLDMPATFQDATPEVLADRCDLVYVGVVDEATATRTVIAIAHKAILSIGEYPGFCSQGGMFCLKPNASEPDTVPFAVNLDAISHSKLRVNPQVLRLTRRLKDGS
ncbi:MAG: YfiR family protein [Zoogloeaceae bacterium]|nr:YfiR family protein [Zoogloeaceae bacterium]